MDIDGGNNLIAIPFNSLYRVDFLDNEDAGTYTGNRGICIESIPTDTDAYYKRHENKTFNIDLDGNVIGNPNNLEDFNTLNPCDTSYEGLRNRQFIQGVMATSLNQVNHITGRGTTLAVQSDENPDAAYPASYQDATWTGNFIYLTGSEAAWFTINSSNDCKLRLYGKSNIISFGADDEGITLDLEPTKISSILGFENNLFIYPGTDPTTLNTLNNFFYKDEEGTISKDIPDGTILYHRSDNITDDATTVFSAIFTNGEWVAAAYDAQIDNLLQPARAYNIQLPANEMGWFIWSV